MVKSIIRCTFTSSINHNMITNIPQHIQDKANQMISKGAKMTFEAICDMYMKIEAKEAKKIGSKKEAAKWTSRQNVEKMEANLPANFNASTWLAEKNRENAKNNLPSSMR